MTQICVLGGGSFGTALAQLFARQKLPIKLWVRSPVQAQAMACTRHNPTYLREFLLHPSVQPTASLEEALHGADLVVSALPSKALRATLVRLKPIFEKHAQEATLLLGTKGLEPDTLLTMHELTCEVLGRATRAPIMVLSGPSFAREIMAQHPTAVVLAGECLTACRKVAELMFCDSFRAYCSTDIVGVEMGGALKNVMAIAAGVLTGLGLGDNSRAALITRGVAEMTRMAVAKGAQPLTLAGLSGLGDLVLTCTGGLSRNRALGQALGEGKSVQQALVMVSQVAEGMVTTKAAYKMAQQCRVDAPIIGAVYRVLYEDQPARAALLDLVRRTPGLE